MFRLFCSCAPALVGALLLAGCQLPTGGPPRNPALAAAEARLFAVPATGKKSSIGQLRYVTPARSVIGDTVVNRSGGGEYFQVDFAAGPGVPLMRLQIAGDEALAEGLFAWGRWRGKVDRHPGRVAQWVALRDVFLIADNPASRKTRLQKAHSLRSTKTPWNATIERDGSGGIRRLNVEFPAKKERFTFVFAP